MDYVSGNDVPFVPPRNKMKEAIRIAEAMKSAKIDDYEIPAVVAAAASKLMEHIREMYLKRDSGKHGKSVRT